MSKYTDEKNRLMEEVLNGRKTIIDINSSPKLDLDFGEAELNKLIEKNMAEIDELSKANQNDDAYAILEKEIKKDFDIKIEDVKAPIYNKDSKEIFEKIEADLNDTVLGQVEAVKNLAIAFRRPFVLGIDPHKIRNSIILQGPNGTGRHLLVKQMSYLMKKYSLQHSAEVAYLDLRRYQSSAMESIFLQDLYVALSGSAEVILFEYFEECYAPFIRMLTNLVTDGHVMMNKRYILKNNQLQESSRGLAAQVVDKIEGNNKILVFLTENKMTKIMDTFGQKFIDSISDRVETRHFDQESLAKIVNNNLFDFIEKCKNQLGISVIVDTTCKDYLLSQYEPDDGIDSINPYIRSFYDNLVQVALENNDIKEAKLIYDKQIKIIHQAGVYSVAEDDNGQIERENLQKELDKIVGLNEIKEYLYSLEDHLKATELRKKRGLKVVEVSKHMIFTGNPGTGKTTIARLISQLMKASGVLEQGQLVEVTRADLVGRYVGHTAPLTMSVIESALGGVLFIDEAYSLYRGKDDSFGLEAIDTLVKAMEDHRSDLIVILAGYSREMKEFLTANSGLKSRFANIIDFPDYSGEELMEIAQVIATSKEYHIEEAALKPMQDYFTIVQASAASNSGNGRLARNLVEDAILTQSKRILRDEKADIELLMLKDFKFEN